MPLSHSLCMARQIVDNFAGRAINQLGKMLFNQLPRIASNYVLEMRLDKFELRILLRILDIPMNRTLNGRVSLNEIELETDH